MKVLGSLRASLVEKRVFIILTIFIALLVFFAWDIQRAIGDGRFFLLHEDEVIYYCSGKVFAETNSVQAEGCIDENVSRIGRMNWYGPGYSVIYGLVFKIFGDGPTVFIWFNVFLGLGIVVVIFFLNVNFELRVLFAICVLMTQQFCVYLFSYFPETLILFLATVLAVVLSNHFLSKGSERNYLAWFIVLTLVFMLVRVTFIFWMAACIPLAKNRRQLLQWTAVYIGSVLIAMFYMKYFTAPPYAGSMHKIDHLYHGDIWKFLVATISSTISNAIALLSNRNSAINILLGLIIGAGIIAYIKKSSLLLSSVLVSTSLLIVMCAYYNVDHFYFIKQTCMLTPLLLGTIIVESTPAIRYSLAVVILVVFPSPIRKMNIAIVDGRNAFLHFENFSDFKSSLREIPNHIQKEATNILYCYNEFDYGNAAEALLPFSTVNHNPILYTTNIVEPNSEPSIKFVTHKRLPIHYILSKNALFSDTLKEVHSTQFYHLYKPDRKQ
jgi:hypothetical protein